MINMRGFNWGEERDVDTGKAKDVKITPRMIEKGTRNSFLFTQNYI